MSRIIDIPAGHALGIATPEATVTIGTSGAVIWNGRKIGRVWKGTRTYSPPLYRGSRVAKYHKQVPCWYGSPLDGSISREHEGDTRREVVQKLIADALTEDQP